MSSDIEENMVPTVYRKGEANRFMNEGLLKFLTSRDKPFLVACFANIGTLKTALFRLAHSNLLRVSNYELFFRIFYIM